MDHHENSIVEEKPNSLFQVDRTFLKKILGRNSFVGQSMRMFQAENVVSVPFDWEMWPGTPKHPQAEIFPPVRPPPAAQSLTLEKPTISSTTHTRMSCIWKKSWKIRCQGKKTAKANKGRRARFHDNNASNVKGNNTPESVDSMSSSDHSRSSSSASYVSSSSSSSSNSSSSSSSSLRSFAKVLVKWSF
ncbi:hypothetical protein DITRI_Ditri14bG0102300 [Diplodiscus trichospermus]